MIMIIHGAPAVGKTTLAKNLSQKLHAILISADEIEEYMADNFADNSYHGVGYGALFYFLSAACMAEGNFVFESCLNPTGAKTRVDSTLKDTKHSVIEVYLEAPDEILVKRYAERTSEGVRHSVHDDTNRMHKLKSHLSEVTYGPIGLGEKVLTLNTHETSSDECVKEVLEYLTTVE